MQVKKPASEYDIVVVGAGMVGASFATLLAKSRFGARHSILAVEAVAPTSTEQPSFDARSTALSFGSSKIFSRMGIWDELSPVVTPIREIQVSDSGHLGSVTLSCDEHGQPALGYVMENRDLGRVLNPRLQEQAGIDYLAPARIVDIKPRQEGMELGIEVDGEGDPTRIMAGLVVLADGGRSPISAQLGIDQQRKDYGQKALIANIAFSKPHNNVAYERFTESGPLAVLPLADFGHQHRGALVWTLSGSETESIPGCSQEDLLRELNQRFGHRLGEITHIGEHFCYPLALSQAREQVRPHLVLLGNVAHTLHPVAGQGLNLALRATETLVDTLVEADVAGALPGQMSVLETYRQRREADQHLAVSLTDQMISLFSSTSNSRAMARKAGLLAMDLVPGLRRGFARQAMGLHAW